MAPRFASWLGGFQDVRDLFRNGLPGRVLAVLLSGTLNQKVIVVLGLAVMLGGLYYLLIHLWQPLLAVAVGAVVVFLAVHDFERSSGLGA